MTLRTLTRAILAQTRTEIVLTLRRGESILVTLIIPVALFVFFASAHILPGQGSTVPFLLTGTVSLAIISTGLVSLGIATAYERYFGVLKWLGATPFPRVGLIAAKLMMVLALEVAQVGILVLIAVAAYGWRPIGAPVVAVAAMLLGTVCFASLGLTMAGALRAEATLAAANGLFLFFLLLGGLFVPLDRLPPVLSSAAHLLPAAALADVLRGVLRASWSIPISSLVVLLIWSIAAPVLAARTFRWE
jgi:ABC-2 type transport system permease protein